MPSRRRRKGRSRRCGCGRRRILRPLSQSSGGWTAPRRYRARCRPAETRRSSSSDCSQAAAPERQGRTRGDRQDRTSPFPGHRSLLSGCSHAARRRGPGTCRRFSERRHACANCRGCSRSSRSPAAGWVARRFPGRFSRCSLQPLLEQLAQLPQAGKRDANAGHERVLLRCNNLCCIAIWMRPRQNKDSCDERWGPERGARSALASAARLARPRTFISSQAGSGPDLRWSAAPPGRTCAAATATSLPGAQYRH